MRSSRACLYGVRRVDAAYLDRKAAKLVWEEKLHAFERRAWVSMLQIFSQARKSDASRRLVFFHCIVLPSNFFSFFRLHLIVVQHCFAAFLLRFLFGDCRRQLLQALDYVTKRCLSRCPRRGISFVLRFQLLQFILQSRDVANKYGVSARSVTDGVSPTRTHGL